MTNTALLYQKLTCMYLKTSYEAGITSGARFLIPELWRWRHAALFEFEVSLSYTIPA